MGDYRLRVARSALRCALLAGTALVSALSAGAASAAVTTTQTFTPVGGHLFTVPAGVNSLTVTAVGAHGGGCGIAGGRGASITATVPVTGGEELFVGVGGVGGDCSATDGSPGPGGVGGGARGGTGLTTTFGGAGGGGASLIGKAAPSPSFESLLVVAGGGGGVGGNGPPNHGGLGGDADSPGSNSCCADGGGAGTQTHGGAGGTNGHGTDGAFGVGGAGGDSGGGFGGGGGGGGYWGGGGGGADDNCCVPGEGGGGGGGGSSFAVASATNVSGPTPTSATAKVTLRYAVPTADESKTSLTFATQPQATVSPEQSVTLTNNGSAPLVVSGTILAGSNPADYLIDNRCQQAVAVGSSCTIGVRFAPQAQGASSATLTLVTNAATAPASITLAGTGGQLPQGPTGPQGKTGPQGPRGKTGKVELITCRTVTVTRKRKGHKVRVKQRRCTGRIVSGIVSFTVSGAADRATLSRNGVVYARGSSIVTASGRSQLILSSSHRLRRGLYTLTLRRGHRVVRSETVRIG
jgi:hypothetical protein